MSNRTALSKVLHTKAGKVAIDLLRKELRKIIPKPFDQVIDNPLFIVVLVNLLVIGLEKVSESEDTDDLVTETAGVLSESLLAGAYGNLLDTLDLRKLASLVSARRRSREEDEDEYEDE